MQLEYFKYFAELLEAPHILVAGSTGSGKSVFLNDTLYTLMAIYPPESAQLVLIDPKRVELLSYKDTAFCLRRAVTLDESVQALENVIYTMELRYKQMERSGEKLYSGGRMFVIVDELADIIIQDKKRVIPLIQRIAQLGRAARISLILATQAPSRQVLPAQVTLNISHRVALHCQSAIESRQIIGISGAEDLPLHGEAIYRTPEKLVKVVDIPYLSEDEIKTRCKYFTK